jgi:hypothetical protein
MPELLLENRRLEKGAIGDGSAIQEVSAAEKLEIIHLLE